jgi:hypothetical protein
LDCGKELPLPAWDFYNDYATGCLQGQSAPTPTGPTPTAPVAPAPTPTNVAPSPYNPGKPTQKPYIPSDGSGSKPYTPADSNTPTSPKKSKKKSHFFRNFLILGLVAGGGYFYYKRRSDTFNFIRYRRTRMFDYDAAPTGESEMYSNLNSSTTFEPPSLPPTPMFMGSGTYTGPDMT